MRRVRITLGYDGTEFFGSQSQVGRRTVQREFEAVLQRIAPGSSGTVFAGRTDRGVHAVGQVVSFDTTWRRTDDGLLDALNAVAPSDLSIVDVRTVDDTFHARYDAVSREYRYRVFVDRVPPILDRRYVWWRRSAIDGERAAAACQRLVGTHALGTFASGGWSVVADVQSLTRTVSACEWHVDGDGQRHQLRIVANGFMPQMVRNIVGAVVQVGSGLNEPGWIDELIAANDRRVLGEAAPARGLVLWQVRYPNDED